MTLTIYGSPRSRTMRTLWMAAELGLEYRHIPLGFDDSSLKEPAFLAINPAGAVPTIVNDGFALSESLAINLHLAKKYGQGAPHHLYPATHDDEARVWQWTLWVQGHLEPWVQQDALLAELRAAIGNRAAAAIHASLTILNQVLTKSPWLVGDRFTVGDLNVAAVLSPSRAQHLDLQPYDAVRDWLTRCYSRPAALATRRRFGG